ncbi:MAG: hypothetical protein U1F11_02715 [Steroidobacteraceae bacterium]
MPLIAADGFPLEGPALLLFAFGGISAEVILFGITASAWCAVAVAHGRLRPRASPASWAMAVRLQDS